MDKKQPILNKISMGYTSSHFLKAKLAATNKITTTAVEIGINQFNGFEIENKIQRDTK